VCENRKKKREKKEDKTENLPPPPWCANRKGGLFFVKCLCMSVFVIRQNMRHQRGFDAFSNRRFSSHTIPFSILFTKSVSEINERFSVYVCVSDFFLSVHVRKTILLCVYLCVCVCVSF